MCFVKIHLWFKLGFTKAMLMPSGGFNFVQNSKEIHILRRVACNVFMAGGNSPQMAADSRY